MSKIRFNRGKYTNKKLLTIYKALITPRLIEEKMLILLRQGKISKWFSGIGQEAISVGATLALKKEEYILPMHRNLGVFTSRNIPLNRLFAQFQGKPSGFTNGRDRSFHFGTNEFNIVGMISHLGPQLAVADGIALSDLIGNENNATLVFTGDGGASEGDFHEALNVAAVWNLPVIFMIENNGYGLSTPSSQQFKFKNFIDKGPGYGIEAHQIDGNNVLEVYSTIERLSKQLRRSPRPVIVEAMTFRMRGHEEASGTKYVPKDLMEFWATKDPINNYENYLLDKGVLTPEIVEKYKSEIKTEINNGLETAYAESIPEANTKNELDDVFAPFNQEVISPSSGTTSEKRYVDAISDGLRQSLEKYDDLIFMGQDIADYGGVFKVSEGFLKKFGAERIRNTPICESALFGMGLGLSIKGRKSVIEMQFADFVTSGFNQVVNNLAKSYYRWGQNADVVVRMPTGAGVAAGPFHSQSNEAWFFHTPGLKIVYPSNPYDAKGLLAAAIEDPNPVMYFEHKMMYRSVTDTIPDDYYTVEIGKAKLETEGDDVSIITYGMGVHWAKELASSMADISIEILNLRTLMPWDKEAVRATVEKTGRVLVLHEDSLTGGIGAEIAAWISEKYFMNLDAPVTRVASLDTPIPFINILEDNFLAKARLKEKLQGLLDF
ncbi:Branched-chain alpha-keto acid dehydrogenase, E1 component, alpha subunit / Branched-chain alpha-keto acid dehydrogenase, E1 component, beta subunit [hydrothermal vent metagenome]|uniref:Branched-chain alpha-keto acid dehydrogenase, E1 component, alpha subunit / Branched-chain alpha-keto acid dehydrogenase, E1 component, beta subunit n=1 Tax=hydrothermal vent metagenome TaxID=652676 RepID=A0A3B0U7B6_9ZZZZ